MACELAWQTLRRRAAYRPLGIRPAQAQLARSGLTVRLRPLTMKRVRLLPALDCVGAALLRHHNVQLMQEMRVDIENDLRCSENVARVKDPIATTKCLRFWGGVGFQAFSGCF